MILFPTPALKRMLIVGIGTAVSQQAVGIDAIQYYLLDVIEESGIQSDKAQLGVLILLGLLKLLFVVVSSKIYDRRGRRSLFFVSLWGTCTEFSRFPLTVLKINLPSCSLCALVPFEFSGMCGALILTSFTFLGGKQRGSVFAIVGLSLYLSFFSIGMGPGAWLIPSEIFATSIRAKAMSMATFFNRIVATLMSSTFLSTANAIGWAGFFLMLAGICVVVFAFIYFLLPETKGRSLEDMSIYFAEITRDGSILEAEKKIILERQKSAVEMTASQPPPIPTGEAA
jgi:MFS family permease